MRLCRRGRERLVFGRAGLLRADGRQHGERIRRSRLRRKTVRAQIRNCRHLQTVRRGDPRRLRDIRHASRRLPVNVKLCMCSAPGMLRENVWACPTGWSDLPPFRLRCHSLASPVPLLHHSYSTNVVPLGALENHSIAANSTLTVTSMPTLRLFNVYIVIDLSSSIDNSIGATGGDS